MVNPGRGDRGCLAGKMQQTVCLAVDLSIGNSVTGNFKVVTPILGGGVCKHSLVADTLYSVYFFL